MNAESILGLLNALFTENISVSPLNGGFQVQLPFSDANGVPIEIALNPSDYDKGFFVDDLGSTAGLLFELAQHRESAPGHTLVKHLTEAYGITMDYDRGILSQAWPVQDRQSILDFIKVIVSTRTVMPEIKMTEFAHEVQAQRDKNIAKWGHQDLAILVIALGEEYGELCKAFLEAHSNIKEEIIQAAALLQVLFEDLGGE